MALNTIFDLNRVTNLETRATNLETQQETNITDIASKINNSGANTIAGTLNVTGSINSLIQTAPIGTSIWSGIMKDAWTYSYALGRFTAGSDKIELRSYFDDMTIRTGRSATATSANFTIITNDANVAGIPQNIVLNPKGILVINPGVYPGNGFNMGLSATGSFPYIQSQNTTISDTQLKFASNGIHSKNGADSAFMAFFGSAFNIGSEREYKTDIEEYNDNALDQVKETPIRKYKYKGDPDDRERIGLIRDESPGSITNKDTVDLYSMVSVLWKSVQELAAKVEELSI